MNGRRRIRTILLSALATMLLPDSLSAQDSKPWVIGEVSVLSGPAATVGTRASKAIRMWVDETNAAGGIAGRKIEHIVCNDENRPEKAVACTRDLMDKGAVLLLGTTLTASLRAMMTLLRNGPVLLLASPNVIPPASSFGFQVSPSDEHITESIARYAKDNGLSKIGMVASTDASGEVGVTSARKVFGAQSIELRVGRIDPRATDASTQLASVVGSDIRLVYSSYSGAGAITVVKSYKNLGLQPPLIVSYANISGAFVQLVKDVAPPRLLGTALASVTPDVLTDAGERARSKAFIEQYAKRHSEPADMINMLGKATADVVGAILRNVPNPEDATAVKKFLESTPIESIQNVRFSPTSHVGLDASALAIVELVDGRWVPAGPIK